MTTMMRLSSVLICLAAAAAIPLGAAEIIPLKPVSAFPSKIASLAKVLPANKSA